MRRHKWHLSNEQNDNLRLYLSDYPAVQAIYHAKQHLNWHLLLKTLSAETARKVLTRITRDAQPARRQSIENTGANAECLAGTHRGDLAVFQEQRYHRRIPGQDGDDDPKSVWV